MKSPPLPKADSIKELAQFWDEHDLTDFEDELEEVNDAFFEPVTGDSSESGSPRIQGCKRDR
ncbi:MAG TPA: hypothetical protein VEW46_15850 [Pyrinomonadaceae bacterium]|nr:hypothetical protein [Pyrinomonadaceae bacterium]